MLIHRFFDDRLWVYFAALLMSLFFTNCICHFRKKGVAVPFAWFWSGLPFFLVSSFRFCVGTDYVTYTVNQIPLIISGQLDFVGCLRYDLLFVAVTKVLRFFTDDNLLIFMTLSLTTFFYSKWIFRDSPKPSYSILLFFFCCVFSTSLNIMRQSFAAGLFWLGFSYLIKGEKRKSSIAFILMLLMHRTAVLFFPLIFLWNKKIGVRKKIVACLSLFAASATFHVSNSSLGFLNSIGIGHYFNSVLDTGDYNIRFLLPVLVLFLLDWKVDLSGKSAIYRAYSNCIFVTLAVICFSSAIPMSSRIIYMLLPVIIVFIPLIAKEMPKFGILILLFFLVYFSGIFYKQIVIDNAHQTLPYRTIWQKNEVIYSEYLKVMTIDKWFVK